MGLPLTRSYPVSTYTVTYIAPGAAEQQVTEVEVTQATDSQTHRDYFYATKLGLWGCGKNASTPEAAIRLLVQDMAQIVWIVAPTASAAVNLEGLDDTLAKATTLSLLRRTSRTLNNHAARTCAGFYFAQGNWSGRGFQARVKKGE